MKQKWKIRQVLNHLLGTTTVLQLMYCIQLPMQQTPTAFVLKWVHNKVNKIQMYLSTMLLLISDDFCKGNWIKFSLLKKPVFWGYFVV